MDTKLFERSKSTHSGKTDGNTGKNVYFKDCETYILCQYEQIQMRIYYDDHFVSGLEITKNVD